MQTCPVLEFSRLELPRLVRRTLESTVEHEAQPPEDRLKERLVDIVEQCQSQLETMFRTVAGPGDTIAATSPRSSAQAFRDVIEPPDDTLLPITSSVIEPVDQHTSSTAAPLPIQLHEASYEGVALSEATEPLSDSSDSGYDSISLAALSATAVHNELPQEYFDPNQYVDLSNYSHLSEATAGTAIQIAQTHADDDFPKWPFVDTFPVMSNENVEESYIAPDVSFFFKSAASRRNQRKLLNTSMKVELKGLADVLRAYPNLKYLQLVAMSDERDLYQNISPLESITRQFISHLSKSGLSIDFFTVALRSLEHKNDLGAETCHLRVRSNPELYETISEKALNRDMDTFGDTISCSFEHFAPSKTGFVYDYFER
ncbi:hypothetical protein J4E91_001077 [Alternaria rosae]|nr:hypothetical protein J4E91_001077 [Alternaria rosae]